MGQEECSSIQKIRSLNTYITKPLQFYYAKTQNYSYKKYFYHSTTIVLSRRSAIHESGIVKYSYREKITIATARSASETNFGLSCSSG